MDIHHLHRQGMPKAAIARRLGIDRGTVRRALREGQAPRYQRPKKTSILDPFKPYIEDRLAKYDLTAKRLLEEIPKQGYEGGYTIVKDHIAKIKERHRVVAVARFETKPGGRGRSIGATSGTSTSTANDAACTCSA